MCRTHSVVIIAAAQNCVKAMTRVQNVCCRITTTESVLHSVVVIAAAQKCIINMSRAQNAYTECVIYSVVAMVRAQNAYYRMRNIFCCSNSGGRSSSNSNRQMNTVHAY